MKQLKGSFFAFSATSMFALNFVSMKILVELVPSMFLVAMRFLIAGFFLFMMAKFLKLDLTIKSKEDFKELAITGFFGMSFYYIFFTIALKYISAPLSSLLCSMIPIITVFFYAIYNRTKVEWIVVIAFVASIYGVYLAIDLNVLSNDITNLLIGIVLMIVAIFGWIYYTIRVEALFKRYNSLVMLMYQSLAGGFVNLILSGLQWNAVTTFVATDINIEVLGHLLFVAIFGSALGYYFFNLGIKYLGVTISSGYNNTMPGITLIASALLLGTEITFRKITGISLVIFITFVVTFKDSIGLFFRKKISEN